MGASVSQRLCSIMFGVALVSGCQTASAVRMEAAPLAVSADACKRDPDPYFRSTERAMHVTSGNAQQVLDTCNEVVAHPGRVTASQLVNAYYFVGVASRYLATAGETPNAQLLDRADGALERALSFSEHFHYARLERARVYQLQGRGREALNEIEVLQRNVADSGDPVHAAAHFIRAKIFIASHSGGPTREDAAVTPSARPLSNTTHEDVLPTLTWDSTLRDLAVFTDAAHAWSPEHREHMDRPEALELLAEYANKLGCFLTPCRSVEMADVWPGAAPTRENVQRGIDYLTLAQAAVDAASSPQQTHRRYVEIYTNLGIAKTQLAGLLAPGASAAFGCVPDVANEAMLNQAKSDLQAALRRSAEGSDEQRSAQLGLACVQLALGEIGDASSTAASAAQSGSAASYVMQARVLAVQENWTDASTHYEWALRVAIDPRARALINLERARAQLRSPPQQLIADEAFEHAFAPNSGVDHEAALISLRDAVAAPPGSLPAQLELGKLHYYRGEYTSTQSELHVFEPGQPAAGYEDHAVRAQALLYLSRAQMKRGQAAPAIRNADDAFAMDGTWPYRKQACLVRITFGRLSFSQSGPRAICGQAEDAPPGEGSLLEGMYHLRRAFLLRAGDREREWEDAYRAFNQGFEAVRNVVVDQSLRDRLQYGRGTAQFCIGFSEIGNQDILAIGDGRAAARSYFQDFGIADCPARR